MTALSTARSTPRKADSSVNNSLAFGCAASQTFYVGALVALNASGYLVPGATATTLTAVGVIGTQPNLVAAPSYASTAVAGATILEVQLGTFKFVNSGSDAVVQADIGKVVYIEDDQTVAHTSTGKSVAGVCVGIDDSTSPTGAGVWVRVGADTIS